MIFVGPCNSGSPHILTIKLDVALQGMTNRLHNVHMYVNKFVVYAKTLEAVESFVRQYNILLLSFVYCDPAFFTG